MLEEGDRIRDYTLKRFLGQGSYGEVWVAEKAIELADDCIPCALKFLFNQDGNADNGAVRNEVATWIKAGNHLNIVPVHDGFIHGRFLIIVSEYVDGGSLRDWLERSDRKPPLDQSLMMINGILRGLAHLHSRKIVHRDLRPENILLKESIPKITDFGLSRMVETFSGSSGLTVTRGAGAPLYMPPEAFTEGKPMPQHDTWSAGVIFYEMLTGQTPFNGATLSALLNEIANSVPKPLASNTSELQEFVSRALAKDVSQRFPTAIEMVDAFEKTWMTMQAARKWEHETDRDLKIDIGTKDRQAKFNQKSIRKGDMLPRLAT